MIHKAKDLSRDQKQAVENLLGRRVLDEESISIRAIELAPISEERRHELVEKLQKYFAEVDANRKNASAQEADTVIDEAMRSIRPGHRFRQ